MEKKHYIALILVVLCLTAYFFFFWKMLAKNSTCEQNPFIYGAKSFQEQGADVSCSCNIIQPNYRDFTFNPEGIEYKEIIRPLYKEFGLINITEFKPMFIKE